MDLFGFSISRRQAPIEGELVDPDRTGVARASPPVNDALVTHVPQRVGSSSWWASIKESFAGAWQHNITVDRADVLTHSTVWACITLIANDIGKLWLDLLEEDADGISTPVENPAYSPVLRKPNAFQTRVKFYQYWVISLLTTGNTYVLKERDNRGVVVALYILDPNRVTVLVAPNGDVFYQCGADPLSGVPDVGLTAPAREIIHDVCVPLYHPLVGLSPIHACGLSAMQGLKILANSTKLFANGSNPGGVLTAPAAISEATAKRLEEHWASNYAGEQNIGKVVVLGDGLTYTPMAMTAVDAEVVDQLKLSDERICATFHVPGYMVGIGPPPPYTDIQSINLQYYTQALQHIVENLETLLEEGLDMKRGLRPQFDVETLQRMDPKTQMLTAKESVSGGIASPNEARAKFDLKAVKGGDSPMMQQQMFSLEALSKRDALPPGVPAVPPTVPPPGDPTANEPSPIDETPPPPKKKPKPTKSEADDDRDDHSDVDELAALVIWSADYAESLTKVHHA